MKTPYEDTLLRRADDATAEVRVLARMLKGAKQRSARAALAIECHVTWKTPTLSRSCDTCLTDYGRDEKCVACEIDKRLPAWESVVADAECVVEPPTPPTPSRTARTCRNCALACPPSLRRKCKAHGYDRWQEQPSGTGIAAEPWPEYRDDAPLSPKAVSATDAPTTVANSQPLPARTCLSCRHTLVYNGTGMACTRVCRGGSGWEPQEPCCETCGSFENETTCATASVVRCMTRRYVDWRPKTAPAPATATIIPPTQLSTSAPVSPPSAPVEATSAPTNGTAGKPCDECRWNHGCYKHAECVASGKLAWAPIPPAEK
jgi:hypothetical protein